MKLALNEPWPRAEPPRLISNIGMSGLRPFEQGHNLMTRMLK